MFNQLSQVWDDGIQMDKSIIIYNIFNANSNVVAVIWPISGIMLFPRS